MLSPRKTFGDSLSVTPHDANHASVLTRRVVVVGDPRSGKRTFASRLFAAAAQQFPASSAASVPLSAGASGGIAFFPNGAGIAQAFVCPQLPTGRTAAVEFFCCDCPGALAMALPTVESLETSVVCVVVDTGAPWRIRAQLRRWHNALAAHAAATLRAEMPRQDEVRRMRLVERQRHFWRAQAQALEAVRTAWRARESGTAPPEEEREEPRAQESERPQEKAKEKAASATLRGDAAGPLRMFIVCARTDVLERLSREAPLREVAALRAANLSLFELVAQALRREAVERHCALVAVGSRVHTTATAAPAAGDAPPSTCVHPLYRTLWAHVAQLLLGAGAEGGDDEDGAGDAALEARSEEMEAQVSAKFHPHAFLPHGMDQLELLSPFVTAAEGTTLESVFPDTGESGEEKGGAMRMHESYVQEIEGLLASAGAEEETMIWDDL